MGNWFCRSKEDIRILIQGLDCAGKTTLLYRLKLGKVVTTIPTIGFNVECLDFKNIRITCWDVGGRDKIRPLYRHYYQNTQGFIFMVDCSDNERLDEALEELVRNILTEDETRDTVVMVLANKQDKSGAIPVSDIEKLLAKKYSGKSHTVFVMPCSAVTGEGMWEALDCFTNLIKSNKSGQLSHGLMSSEERDQEVEKVNQVDSSKWSIKSLMKTPKAYLKYLFP